MKREAKLLLDKARDSLILSVEIFNRPHDCGRATTTLILLDHAFEMLLKAAILHRGGRIREEKRARETFGFDSCVRIALSTGDIKFLTDEQALTLQVINGLRDAAQHHILEISEGQLYLQAQAGLTLFHDLLKNVFGKDLALELPERVLPLATQVPTDLMALFAGETAHIKQLLAPGRRRQTEATARLRPLAILDATIRGEKGQPIPSELNKMKALITKGTDWSKIFSGVASIQMTTEGDGPTLALRLTKKEGVPVQLVPEGTPGASVIAIKRVDELGFYNLGRDQVAEHVGLSGPKTTAVIRYLKMEEDPECFRHFKIGKTEFKRYSQRAIDKIKAALDQVSIDKIWVDYGSKRGKKQ